MNVLEKEISSHYEQGFWAGYEVGINAPLPAWWFEKPAARWLPYERGYWLGREVRVQELTGAEDNTDAEKSGR